MKTEVHETLKIIVTKDCDMRLVKMFAEAASKTKKNVVMRASAS